MPESIALYFDPISPYSWLAGRQVAALNNLFTRIELKPVLFAAILNAHGTPGPAEIPAKRAYIMRDVMRSAARLGLPFEGPPTHPFNPLLPLRMCTAVENPTDRLRFGIALMDAAWSQGLDITDGSVLSQIANECKLDAGSLLGRAASSEIKQMLVDATQAAVNAGVFGVPTFRYHDELFWGNDRIEALLWRLQGHTIDENHFARVLARPASATRRAQ